MTAQLDSFFVTVPSEKAYLSWCPDIAGWIQPYAPETPKYAVNSIGVFTYNRALELALAVEWPWGTRHIAIEPAPICACCGRTRFRATLIKVDHNQWRCDRHVGRNPCVVEGCGRTRDGSRPRLDIWICGRHWKLVPRRLRDVHKRLWRLQRKSGGWTTTLNARYWRIWPRLVVAAQRAARGEGDLDIAAIEREFGA